MITMFTSGEDSRRTINWENQSSWDTTFLNEVKKLISIRKQHDALINGGLRWILVEDDCIAFLRESKKETLLVFISRGAVQLTIDLAKYGYVVKESLYGISGKGASVSIQTNNASQAVWVLESSQKLRG